MQYIQITIPVTDALLREQLIAQLAELNFEAFEEQDDVLLAYVQAGMHDEEMVAVFFKNAGLSITSQAIEQQNWNAQWEESFQPVIVEGFCTVRAAFHKIEINTPYEIVITPKMSFGTGHHATTQLMMEQMQHISFDKKSVFDFGTGTGILAILAKQLGAAQVIAADNDEWSYENAAENVQQNNVTDIAVKLGSIELVAGRQFDVILANINRHILLRYMQDMYAATVAGGQILMSGLLQEDFDMVRTAAETEGFRFVSKHVLNNWIVLLFNK